DSTIYYICNTRYAIKGPNDSAYVNISLNSDSTKFLFRRNNGGVDSLSIYAGTVTSVSDLSPLFTTTNRTSTPTFNLSNACAGCFFGNITGSTGAPSYTHINALDTAFLKLIASGFASTVPTNKGLYLQDTSAAASGLQSASPAI